MLQISAIYDTCITLEDNFYSLENNLKQGSHTRNIVGSVRLFRTSIQVRTITYS